jgi:hypothetical protein
VVRFSTNPLPDNAMRSISTPANVHGGTIRFLLVGLLVVLLVLCALIFTVPLLNRALFNNVVWLAVMQRTTDEKVIGFTQVEALFTPQIERASGANARTRLGLGILAAWDGNESDALTHWQQDIDRKHLLHFGQQAQQQGQLDRAMLLFRGAGEEMYEPGWYAVGSLCQMSWAQLDHLTSANQERCQGIIDQNQLLVNGDFASGTLDGWLTQGGKTLLVDSGLDAPAIRLHGSEQNQRHSLYQRLSLLPGTVIRFSMYVRVPEPASTDFRLLYIGFEKPDGSAAGNALSETKMSIAPDQWRLVERIYTIPAAKNQSFLFAPVQVWGSAQVDAAHVQLEIVEQP